MVIFRLLRIFLLTALLLSVVYPTYSQESDLEKLKALDQKVLRLAKEGRYAYAISLSEKVLAIREKIFGPEHPEVAQVLNFMGVLYSKKRQSAISFSTRYSPYGRRGWGTRPWI